MSEKRLPCSEATLLALAAKVTTPFYLYDETSIRAQISAFKASFAWVPAFKNYFAVKACPNPTILKIMLEEGFGADCSSLAELELARRCGFKGEQIMFTSNDTPDEEFSLAYAMGAVMNLDDITHLDCIEKVAAVPELISFRYNPGPSRTGNAIIGNPVEAKYGVTTDQLVRCYELAKKKGAKRFALHTMVASNELDGSYIVETARMLFGQAIRIFKETGIKIEFINMGGGIGIPYRPDQSAMDLDAVSSEMKHLYESMIVPAGLAPLNIVFECGRMVTGPYGYVVSKVRHVVEKYKRYVGLDACMANLMRPALYGAYHHISVLGKSTLPPDQVYDVTGSLCENNDKFAIDRKLPRLEKGDVVILHDAGAHGYAMGFNYNGKLRSAEYLLCVDESVKMIRRAETIDDYFSTMLFDPLHRLPKV
ncbi:MAG: diaminopimelate decarboxylase [Sphaerochaetaceae bacterium]|jgi:diaminopimelate decarboxylase|nr:diaminopimelate decarboxylase [Sphaerochaetaceae bacterium]MDD2405763.1 diaminopimelate decarboxylase [Sphaerochaetaceae bacterium]MDD4259224.1 diaminopimelate decarboxylase [Sphaerochaetaceae bacterium]MDD4840825.1 diaminopimelate decarboxylase [Sphaerochaetaceae bacterium]MDX9934133.1 diaminopimelate decarboxylase [Sphaerochaetaceae bacterium]